MSVPNRPESEYNAALKMWGGKVGGSHPPAPAHLRPLMVVPARAGHAKELLEHRLCRHLHRPFPLHDAQGILRDRPARVQQQERRRTVCLLDLCQCLRPDHAGRRHHRGAALVRAQRRGPGQCVHRHHLPGGHAVLTGYRHRQRHHPGADARHVPGRCLPWGGPRLPGRGHPLRRRPGGQLFPHLLFQHHRRLHPGR